MSRECFIDDHARLQVHMGNAGLEAVFVTEELADDDVRLNFAREQVEIYSVSFTLLLQLCKDMELDLLHVIANGAHSGLEKGATQRLPLLLV